jgi:predicted Zn-dependent protease with MMP-like domain
VSVRLRAAAAALALVVGLGAVAFWAPVPRLVSIAAGAVLGVLVLAGLTTFLAGWREPASEEEFDALVERSERLAHDGEDDGEEPDDDDWDTDDLFDPSREEDFRALVARALDDLPLEFTRALDGVAVVVSDGGRRRRAYGLYHGDGVSRDTVPDRIVVYRDTLVRDFGHDPVLLKAQITRTVRHELAHHLGWDEPGVRGLGL